MPKLDEVLQRSDTWCGNSPRQLRAQAISTGHEALDQCLHLGGWPTASLTELYPSGESFGELSLLMPSLATLSQAGKAILMVNPPYIPYAPALEFEGIDTRQLYIVQTRNEQERLWAYREALSSQSCAAVLCWQPHQPKLFKLYRELRRLQLAAQTGQCLGFLFCPPSALKQQSPAALRLQLQAKPGISPSSSSDNSQLELDGLAITVIKQRGGQAQQHCHIPRASWLQPQIWPQPAQIIRKTNPTTENFIPLNTGLESNDQEQHRWH